MTSRLRLRTIAGCTFAAAIFVLGCGAANADWIRVDAARPDVVRIIVRPYLLGKSPLVAVRAPRSWRGSGTIISLRSIERVIPDPLPLPFPERVCRAIKVTLTVVMRDGQRLTYGPCTYPNSILHLRWTMYRVAAKKR
jgi:hypothetical protein